MTYDLSEIFERPDVKAGDRFGLHITQFDGYVIVTINDIPVGLVKAEESDGASEW